MRNSLLALTLFMPVLVWGQAKTAKSPALLKFDRESVTQSEFERVYAKNNGGPEEAAKHSPQQLQEYLDLYIRFKRKVFEAEARGLDTTAQFRSEFEGYRKQLVQPYLLARDVEEKLIEEAYQRSQTIINASHLLVRMEEDAAPQDTLIAFNKIRAYRDSVVNGGRSFAYMAARYSEDPSARDNNGDLGYFSVFDMVYPFESGAYRTLKGQLSQPVRTRFGYHLIQVHDKLPNDGAKRAAHIIVRMGDRYSAQDTAQAQARINEIYEKLRKGEDFAALAASYSDDPGTAGRGGDLGTNRLLPEMEAIKMKLGKGQFSEPFTTRFGWHIMQVSDVEAPKTFEEARLELRRRIERDTRSQISRDALVERIKADNIYRLQQANFDAFVNTLPASFAEGAWTPEAANTALFSKTLFTLGKKKNKPLLKRTLQDFVDFYTRTRPRYPKLEPQQAAQLALGNFVNFEMMEFEERQLPNKNPEFAYLVKEYRDGILLFTLMEQMVWKKAVEDTTGLKNFYEANKREFMANRSVDLREYRSSDIAVMNRVAELLKAGASDRVIDSTLNQGSSLKLTLRTMSYEEGKEEAPSSDVYGQVPQHISNIISTSDGGFAILKVLESYPAGIKPFEKAKAEAITRYQDYLEQQWLKDLEYKYPVQVNESVLGALFKSK